MDDRSVLGPTPLTVEVIDGICEAVLVSPHPRGRSDTICNIVEEICETIAWFHGSRASGDQELASLQHLLAAAQAHQQRMDAGRPADPLGLLQASESPDTIHTPLRRSAPAGHNVRRGQGREGL